MLIKIDFFMKTFDFDQKSDSTQAIFRGVQLFLTLAYSVVLNWSNYRFYWIGLNDVKRSGTYEWVCSLDEFCAQKLDNPFRWWAEGMPDQANPDWRCTYALFSVNLPGDFGRDGKWVKGECSDKNAYICQVRVVRVFFPQAGNANFCKILRKIV